MTQNVRELSVADIYIVKEQPACQPREGEADSLSCTSTTARHLGFDNSVQKANIVRAILCTGKGIDSGKSGMYCLTGVTCIVEEP